MWIELLYRIAVCMVIYTAIVVAIITWFLVKHHSPTMQRVVDRIFYWMADRLLKEEKDNG